MTLIVGASVAALWFFADPRSSDARLLLQGVEELIAPELVLAEAGSAFRKLRRSGRLDPEDAALAARRTPAAFDRIVSIAPLLDRALEIAVELGHPIYDCFYVALAEAERATMLTIERRLLERIAASPYSGMAKSLA